MALNANELADAIDSDDIAARVDPVRSQASLDFLILSEGGAVVAASTTSAQFRPGVTPPGPDQSA